jgi:hypothetical protein
LRGRSCSESKKKKYRQSFHIAAPHKHLHPAGHYRVPAVERNI